MFGKQTKGFNINPCGHPAFTSPSTGCLLFVYSGSAGVAEAPFLFPAAASVSAPPPAGSCWIGIFAVAFVVLQFFVYLRKGPYVFEYALFATHTGNFSNGITSIQCMYAPEFSSHSEGIRLNVE